MCVCRCTAGVYDGAYLVSEKQEVVKPFPYSCCTFLKQTTAGSFVLEKLIDFFFVIPSLLSTTLPLPSYRIYLAFVFHCVSYPQSRPGPFRQLDMGALMVAHTALPG